MFTQTKIADLFKNTVDIKKSIDSSIVLVHWILNGATKVAILSCKMSPMRRIRQQLRHFQLNHSAIGLSVLPQGTEKIGFIMARFLVIILALTIPAAIDP
jgi:hypothetical protein